MQSTAKLTKSSDGWFNELFRNNLLGLTPVKYSFDKLPGPIPRFFILQVAVTVPDPSLSRKIIYSKKNTNHGYFSSVRHKDSIP